MGDVGHGCLTDAVTTAPASARGADPAEQLALLRGAVRSRRPRRPKEVQPALSLPVARVVVEVGLSHLDRPFDYLVPESLSAAAVPGARVRVRFSGRDVDGFVVERLTASDHPGALSALRRVVSPEPVLTPRVLQACRLVADRYAGTLADVLRLAVPPRHGRVEAEPSPYLDATTGVQVSPEALRSHWEAVAGGRQLVDRLLAGSSARAVWTAPAGLDWPLQTAAAAAATVAAGRGALLCLADNRAAQRVAAALEPMVGSAGFVLLTAEQGPAARYRAFLAAARGQVQVVVGTRSAALAPVRDLGLVALWDDGDDSFVEPRAPYPHAREVLLTRAQQEHAAALVGGYSRSVEAQALVESGWAVALAAPRAAARAAGPEVHVTGETDADLATDPAARVTRMPRAVFEVVREGLRSGPVLVHTPLRGYQAGLACAACRRSARCGQCSGPLGRAAAGTPPQCRWCGVVAEDWACPDCGGRRLRVSLAGALRTVEEWGRAFPGTPVRSSTAGHLIEDVDERAQLVVATPGAEPLPAAGFAAAVLLDTGLTLGRPGLRTAEEAVRRWFAIAALVRPAAAGGRLLAVGDPASPALQALVRADPEGFAARELAERAAVRLPPVARLATLTGPAAILAEVTEALDLPRAADVLGPVEVGDGDQRVVVRVPKRNGTALSRALQQVQSLRSSRKLPPVRVQVDPYEL